MIRGFAVNLMDEAIEGLEAVLLMRLRDVLFDRLHLLAIGDRGQISEQGVDVQARVPDIEVPHRRESPHCLAVFADRGENGGPSLLGGEFAIAPGDLKACGEALQIPLPWPRKGLIEVIDVQYQAPIGGGEDAEVGEVGIAACLNPQPGIGGLGEVHRHDRRCATKEGERRGQHPPIANRHELGDSALGLVLEQLDRIFAVFRRLPLAVSGARGLLASRLANCGSLTCRGIGCGNGLGGCCMHGPIRPFGSTH